MDAPGSGTFNERQRQTLQVPTMYIALGIMGRNKFFDRVWTLASILLMGMSVMLYSFDMWVE